MKRKKASNVNDNYKIKKIIIILLFYNFILDSKNI